MGKLLDKVERVLLL